MENYADKECYIFSAVVCFQISDFILQLTTQYSIFGAAIPSHVC